MLLMLIISKVGEAQDAPSMRDVENKQIIDVADLETTQSSAELEITPESKNSYVMLFIGLMIHDVSEGVMLGL